jgi:hypothetical protein
MTFTLFKFLHIAFMFTAVAMTVIPEVVLHFVANSRETRTISTMSHLAERIGKVVPVFFVGGAIFGLLAAWTGEMDFTAPWLIATYVLFVAAIVTGTLITDPWVGRLKNAAVANGDAPPSAELSAVIDDSRAKAASATLMLITITIIALMVFKPGA